jgi:hypothetical protein
MALLVSRPYGGSLQTLVDDSTNVYTEKLYLVINSIVTNKVDASLSITNLNATLTGFVVSGDKSDNFVEGVVFTITGSTGNDGVYTVVSSTYDDTNTIITVDSIVSDVADGQINFIQYNTTVSYKIYKSQTVSARFSSSIVKPKFLVTHKTVVENVEFPDFEISLEDAMAINEEYKLDDEIELAFDEQVYFSIPLSTTLQNMEGSSVSEMYENTTFLAALASYKLTTESA